MANRGRFRALREFTVEGALAELDRQALERKDKGLNATDTRSSFSRPGSIDCARGPQHARPTALDDVPEDGRFTIGDDDDEEEHDDGTDASTASSHAEGDERGSLSDKARGKQRATNASIGSTSRNVSTASLPSMAAGGPPSQFYPTQEWMDSWHPRIMPLLDNILKTIDLAETKQLHFKEAPPPPPITPLSGATTPRPSDAELAKTTPASESGSPAPDSSSHKIAFEWTAMAIGWYTALIWSRIYLTEAEIFQGSGGLYSSTNIALFRRGREQPAPGGIGGVSLRSPKGAIDAVGDGILRGIQTGIGNATGGKGAGDGTGAKG